LQARAVDSDIAHGVEHRLVIALNQHVAGGAGALEVRIQASAIKQRQRQARNKVDLLAAVFEQFIQVNGIDAEERFDIKARVEQARAAFT
jgi:shikimate kinase